MAKVYAALETGTTGLWYGRLTEHLGTHARAATRDQALVELEEELRYHQEWLRRHGETPPRVESPEITVAEEVTGVSQLGESGGEVALFRYDFKAVSPSLLEECVKRMGYNRSDLLAQVRGLSAESMSVMPPGKKRNITQILSHVCNAEEFYASRLGPEADRVYESSLGMRMEEADRLSVFQRLEAVRRGCVETLRQVAPGKEDRVFTRAEYTSYPGERWTAHKVLRRFLEHEREHIYNIREYLGLRPRGPVLKP